MPPPFQSTPPFVQTLRYVPSSAASESLSAKEIVIACGAVCSVANSTLSSVFAACRIKRIRAWVWGTAGGGNNSLSFDFYGTGGNNARERTITSYSTEASFLEWKPRPGDQAYDMCLAASTTAVIGIAAPASSCVIDIDVVCYPFDTGTAGTTLAVAVATLGAFYWPVLDNGGSKYLNPVGRPSTT